MNYPEIDTSISYRRFRIAAVGIALIIDALFGRRKTLDTAHKFVVWGDVAIRRDNSRKVAESVVGKRRQEQ
ncbi:hypothetical protein KKJ29_19990 [Xenorhabdus bovienii]|nr:hypothetical protein [Xenorhabdus bovienii]